jgi:type II secretory pathway pseudopilin PulG
MTTRDRLVILVVLVVAALAGSWLLVIQPKRDQAGKLGGQVHAAQTQLDTARAQVAQGEAARNAFASNYTQLVRLGEAVPADDNVPSLIFQLQGAAKGTSVDFRSLQLNPGAGGGTATSSQTGSQTSSAQLPPGATFGPAGFPGEQFTFTFRGNFFHLADFFDRVQRFVVANNNHISVRGRLMTLNSINLGPGSGGFPQIAATVSATTFMVPASEGLLNGATPAGPTGASSSPSTPSGSSTPAAAVTAP